MLVLIQSTRKRGGKHWVQEGKIKKNCYFFFYKIVNKEAPDYLYELVPPLVAANVNYNLRNSHNIHVPFNRLSVYQNSYFPCTIQALNSLDRTITNTKTLFWLGTYIIQTLALMSFLPNIIKHITLKHIRHTNINGK